MKTSKPAFFLLLVFGDIVALDAIAVKSVRAQTTAPAQATACFAPAG
jgi:hypothetical protein